MPRCLGNVQGSAGRYDDESLSRTTLNDDFQQLFLDIVLKHVADLLQGETAPLRLLLLGTAGTGKTTTVQTTLQEIYRVLDADGTPVTFVRVAAPTGCAAWNVKFNATTVHQLIRHGNPFKKWAPLTSDDAIIRLQRHLSDTQLIFLDEVSMVGRQLMAKIDDRFGQAKPDNPKRYTLGGVSCVGIGDPAQCEAIGQQQMYDKTLHKETAQNADASHVALSNRGLDVYSEFTNVVILSNVHRLHKHV